MNISPARRLAILFFSLMALAFPAQAQLLVGRDYVAIEPVQMTDNAAKIEVVEFFSYACPHCGDLNPHIIQWANKQPSDVVFKRIPVGFNPFYQLMAKLYYSLEAIGELQRLDTAIFYAIHGKGLKLIDEKSIAEWVTSQGVDAKKFSDAYNSFGVSAKAKRAEQIAGAARISSVPAIVVDGRYLLTGKEVKSHADLLVLAEKVIEMRRAERNSKKK